MVSKTARAAIQRLWNDRCTVFHREKVRDPNTKLTDFVEKPLFTDQPCKLSFETLSSTDGDNVATLSQSVKLFISPDLEIPAGCKIQITRPNDTERVFNYSRSGEAGVFSNHQEIMLVPFKGYA